MLKQRIITAVVLLAILLPAMFYTSPAPFCALALALIAAAGWEWGRLNACGSTFSVLLGFVIAALCSLSWYLGLLEKPLAVFWLLCGVVWVLSSAALLWLGVPGWSRIPRTLRLVAGAAVLWLAWLAIAQARVMGIGFLLSVLLLVWVADIAAYAAGRTFGGQFTRSKLAPTISPGKSWEGVWGAMVGVAMLAVGWAWLDRAGYAHVSGSIYVLLWAKHGAVAMLLGALFLVVMSVVGDLAESLVKRSAGVKDSSGLLPGHGGVLDRIDALLPAVPLAVMLASL